MDSKQPPPGQARILSSAERRQRVIPLSFQLSGIALNLISVLHNEWAAGVLSRFWFTVFKSDPRPWVAEFWSGAHRRVEVTVDDVTIPVHCWGQGPVVVLMHGWSGTGTQFRYFITPLVEAGFCAVCFDAPEHGSNPGRQTHMLRFSDSLIAIQRQLGEVDCVIAHSLGAMAATYAMQGGFNPRHAVLVAPHLDVQKMFETYRDLLNMRPALAQRFHQKIGSKMQTLMDGVDPWELLLPGKLLADPELHGMLVYDQEDPEITTGQFLEMIDCWPTCEVHATRGLGHNRILKDEAVITRVVEYLKEY